MLTTPSFFEYLVMRAVCIKIKKLAVCKLTFNAPGRVAAVNDSILYFPENQKT